MQQLIEGNHHQRGREMVGDYMNVPREKKVLLNGPVELELANLIFGDEKSFLTLWFVDKQNDRVYLSERPPENLNFCLAITFKCRMLSEKYFGRITKATISRIFQKKVLRLISTESHKIVQS